MPDKIVTLATLTKILKNRRGKKVVFTNGCFDILHYGHVAYLQKARSLGDILIVGVNSDSSVRGLKGKNRPLTSQNDRMRVLAALACVDYVVLFHNPTPLRLIKVLRPDILVKGKDWAVASIVGAREVLEAGGKVRTISYIKNRSTTGIIEKILKQHPTHVCCCAP